jgi:hypothetical protein
MKPRRDILLTLLSLGLISNASITGASNNAPEHFNEQTSPIGICKLIKQPSKYAGKTIRLKAVLVENHTPRVDGGDPYLYDPACRDTDFDVVVEWSSEESYQPIKNIAEEPDSDGYVRASVVLVGTFHYSGTRSMVILIGPIRSLLFRRLKRSKLLQRRHPGVDSLS